ncbi:MAG: prepilin-type N-terminal cleavage/methylation domain-containing protein [Chloroherpetonaceae bacterium]|nr:prepilin-type N-terminal cleavage/methylation domain-containing protein [Chloroherpetonaceae bacterium]
MYQAYSARKGFSLVELLTVIAIIAILAAIAFPVFNNVRKKQRESTCLTQMHDLYRNLKLYYADNNKYPAALLGFAENIDGTFYTGSGQPVSLERLTYRPLTGEQRYLKDKNVFSCPDNPVKDPQQVTTVVYPPNVPLTGTVVFTQRIADNIRNKAVPAGQPIYFYTYDSYDIGPRLDSNGRPIPNTWELHYSLDWTGGSGPGDPPNQLKYASTAPENSTVVTWCTHHAALAGSDQVNVLLLSGTAKNAPVRAFMAQGPLNFRF